MGRILSPFLCQELANLEKGENERKSAMRALTAYIKGMDSEAIPLILRQLAENKDDGSYFGEHTISLYEVVARVHGPKIVPQIDNITDVIIKTLISSGGSLPIRQACSKVVATIARYAIEPTTPETDKRYIIHSLCAPLAYELLGTQEDVSSGVALCLKALVDCNSWRFAEDEMVNQVCLRLAGAMEDKFKQSSSHMGLVMSLAKFNSVIVEPYARLLIRYGLRILDPADADLNPQKQSAAIHMIDLLMKCLDIRSISSELALIIKTMEQCLSDQTEYVSEAASGALQTAIRLAENGETCDKDLSSATGSSFRVPNGSSGRSISSRGDRLHSSISPMPQNLRFNEYGRLIESPLSESQVFSDLRDRKKVNRKLWNHDSGGIHVSPKDGLFSEIPPGSTISHRFRDHHAAYDERRCGRIVVSGFSPGMSMKESFRSHTPSPQRSNSHINPENANIFSIQTKLVRSLQEHDANTKCSKNEMGRFRFSCPCKCECCYIIEHDPNDLACDEKTNGNSAKGKQCHRNSESVSSTEDIPLGADSQVSLQLVPVSKNQPQDHAMKSSIKKAKILYAIFVGLFALILSTLWPVLPEQRDHVIPT